MKVLKAWKAGYTGKNISVTILDDGIEHTHDDLHANYVSVNIIHLTSFQSLLSGSLSI